MIHISTRRFRGMVMHRRIEVGPLVYEFDRGETTTRSLRRL